VLEKPNELARFAARNGRGACRHDPNRLVVIDEVVAHEPVDRRRSGVRKKAKGQIVARVNYLVTMPG
jgi:hypothetical protein